MGNIYHLKTTLACLSVILPASSALSQTGPGGVGSAANNVLWISADRETFTDAGATASGDGQGIAQWNDLSGNGNNASQATSSNRAIFETNELNGRPVARFNGSSHELNATLGLGPFTSACVFSVARFAQANQANGDYDVLYSLGNMANDAISFGRTAGDDAGGADLYYSFTEGASSAGPSLNDQFQIACQSFTSSAPYHFLRLNGAAQTVGALAAPISVGATFNLGRLIGANPEYMNGDVAEIIVFETVPNTTQTNIVENYLSSKYDIAVATDLYDFDSVHGHNVSGIGRETITDFHDDAQGLAIVHVNSPSSLGNGDYMLWGHDTSGFEIDTSNVPPTYVNDGGRWEQTWRVDLTGDPGEVTVAFDITGAAIAQDPDEYELLISANGDFETGILQQHVTGLSVVGNTVTFTNVDFADGNYFTLGNNGTFTQCTTLTSGSWHTPSLWSCNMVPDSTIIAVIDTGHSITSSASASAGDLIVYGSLQNNSDMLIGRNLDIANIGQLSSGVGSDLIFRGSAGSQTMDNLGTAVLHDLTIDNASGVIATGNWELNNAFNLDEGNFTSSDVFLFTSNPTRTAHLGRINVNYDLLGAYTVERYVSAREETWGGIASPVHGADFNDLDDDIYISGAGGADGNACCPIYRSMYRYNAINDEYEPVLNINDPITNGQGYEVWLAHDTLTWLDTSWYLTGSIDVNDQIISMDANDNGMNLIGNPYPAFLSWTSISANNSLTGVSDEFWVYDASDAAYVNKGDGDFIPPGQGVWIQMTSGTSIALSAANDRSVGTSSSMFYQAKRPRGTDELIVSLEKKNDKYKSYAFLRKALGTQPGRDEIDMAVLQNHDTLSCSVSFAPENAENLMVNYTSATEEEMHIPLEVSSHQTGEFRLSMKGLEAFGEYPCASITDAQTGTTTDLYDQGYLDIAIEKKDVAQQYLLHFSRDEDCGPKGGYSFPSPIHVFANEKTINLDFNLPDAATADVRLYNPMGQNVMNDRFVAGKSRHQMDGSFLTPGVYFVTVTVNGEQWNSKIQMQ